MRTASGIALYFNLVGACCLVACDDDGGAAATPCESAVPRETVLEGFADQTDADLADALRLSQRLTTSLQALQTGPSQGNLTTARDELTAARVFYAQLAPASLVVDPAQTQLSAVAAFPVDTATVNAYASEGTFDPESASDFDRGYPAIEFLLYGANPQAAAQRFAADPARLELAIALAEDVERRLLEVSEAWDGGGRDAFVSDVSTGAGSGLSRALNSISKHFEDTRRDRLGTPFGVTLGFPSPRTLEAPYSRRSRELLITNVTASQYALGAIRGMQATISSYVDGLDNGEATALLDEVYELYEDADGALTAIDGDLYDAIESDRDAVQVAYNAISRQVVNLKTDLPSVTCVSITYVDNPSDSD